MDHKPWLWRKKSSEKATTSGDKVNCAVKASDEEIKIIMVEKAGLEKNLRIVNDTLSSALLECNTKDELVKKNTNVAQEAIAGWERAEAEAIALRQELDEAIKQRDAGEERIAHLDSALEECMKQLHFVREEKEQRIHDAFMKTSSEFEKSRTELEEKLKETGERFSKMGVESTQLSKALLAKEKIIDDLHKQLAEADANFNTLLSRLESTEKDNNSLIYEVRVLEKEVEIRNEEREFNRRTSESSHKQHLDGVKRIAKLESECQRLRILVRKRLPGPAALAKMKNEVEILGRDSSEMRRKQSTPTGFVGLSNVDHSPETPNKRISVLTEQLSNLEEQNRFLKEALNKKMVEHQLSKIMHTSSTSKVSNELCRVTISYAESDDMVSSAESLASSLITDLYHFSNGQEKCSSPCKTKTIGGSLDLNLMDDFAEMEKLAIDSVNTPVGNSQICSNKDYELAGSLIGESNESPFNSTAGKTVKLDNESGFSPGNPAVGSKNSSINEVTGLNQNQFLQSNPDKTLENTQIALAEKDNHVPSDLKDFICKLIELVEGISFPSPDYDNSEKVNKGENLISEVPTGYMIRVFLWKISELSAVLNQFLCNCRQMLNGRASFCKFVEGLTIALDWILNHCFSHQDVSSIKHSFRKQFDLEESRSENEVESGMTGLEVDKSSNPNEKLCYLTMAAVSINLDPQIEQVQSSVKEENNKLEEELVAIESEKKRPEGRHESATERNAMQKELEADDKIQNQNQSLGNQRTAIRFQLNDAHQDEYDRKHKCQTGNVESSFQLESSEEKQNPKNDSVREDKCLRTDLEITAASEKLAECQETILNLSRQLKELAATKQAALSNNVVTPPITINQEETNVTQQEENSSSHRSSLLDRMAEDDAAGEYKLPKSVAVDGNSTATEPQDKFILVDDLENQVENGKVDSWAIVPTKKLKKGSLWRRLLWRKKKGKSLKLPITFTS